MSSKLQLDVYKLRYGGAILRRKGMHGVICT